MRKRLRDAHSPDVLAKIYPVPHDHTRWPDHIERVAATIELARSMGPVDSVADLSCGSAAVARAVDAKVRHLGDLAAGYRYVGPIEQTIDEIPDVDLFICTETLEHLDDPDTVLKSIRGKSKMLVLSTPLEAWDDTNLEHYWALDRDGVEEMLTAAGFEVEKFVELDFRPRGPYYYCFGLFGCR